MRASSVRLIVAVVVAFGLGAPTAPGEERWLEVRSPHFRVITDAGEKHGRQVATGFEQVRRLFEALGHMRVDPPAPIVIVATRNEAGLRSFLPFFWERSGGVRPAGVFLAGTDKHHIALRLDVEPELRDNVVYHEYVHLITRLNVAGLPLWLNEGLAEFFAGTSVRDDKVVYGRVNVDQLGILRQRAPLPLARLFAIGGGSREYNEESRASILYAESALLTHYFLVGDEGARRGKLIEYLALLSQGVPAEQAQARAFGDLKALQKAFYSYLRHPWFPAMELPLDVGGAQASVRALGEAEALAVRGDFLARHGRPEEARSLLTKAREMDPKLALAAQGLGVLDARTGRTTEARRHLAEAIRLAPDDFSSHYLWAREMPLFGEGADPAAAEAALRLSLQLNPSFAPAHALLSSVLRQRGQLEQAFLSLNEACDLEPTDGRYWVQRADLLREMKHPDVAEQIETQLARLAVSDPWQLHALATYYRTEGRLDDLERLLRDATDVSPHGALAPLMLGEHLRTLGRADEAEAAFRRALAAQPDNPTILNSLAYHNADRAVKLPESLELIERALKRSPKSSAMLDTKGWVLFRMGRLDEAEKLLRRSLARRDDPEVLEHLGDLLDRRGREADAEEMWRRALDHPQAADERKEALRRKLAPPSLPPGSEDGPAGTDAGTESAGAGVNRSEP